MLNPTARMIEASSQGRNTARFFGNVSQGLVAIPRECRLLVDAHPVWPLAIASRFAGE